MEPPALLIDNLSKHYGKQRVLQGLSLAVNPGATFALVGMNGAGKTTLIKCLLDFCAVDAGRIEILGVPHTETRARRALAYLPESFAAPHYLTGREFIQYLLALRDCPYREAEVQRLCAALDLEATALDRPAREFSKGMGQKLGLVACLASDALLLVLDEPTSGLDPKARALLKGELARAKAAGRTLFFTSHALADVDEMADAMAILHQGVVRFTGTPAECRAAHQAETLEAAYLRCIA